MSYQKVRISYQRVRIADSAPHLYNGRHVYGNKLSKELDWMSDDAALVGALLLHRVVSDRNF